MNRLEFSAAAALQQLRRKFEEFFFVERSRTVCKRSPASLGRLLRSCGGKERAFDIDHNRSLHLSPAALPSSSRLEFITLPLIPLDWTRFYESFLFYPISNMAICLYTHEHSRAAGLSLSLLLLTCAGHVLGSIERGQSYYY